jgi:glycine/D-amino acid oxidase-like deaminating enzyme
MHRRVFIQTGGSAALGIALGGCASRIAPAAAPAGARRRRLVNLAPVECSMDRIIRTTVGLRPHRDSGFLLRAERLDDKTVIHHFGHGGAGMSLSWGTASLAADLALAHTERRAAVIGCGIIGLTSARQLQRRGFDVTIYAMTVPPDTTSNLSFASFTPTAGLVSPDGRTPAWDEQFRRAVKIAYLEHQLLAGPHYGVSWINEYGLFDDVPAALPQVPWSPLADNLPADVDVGSVLLLPGEHPFGTRYATQHPTMRFEPSIYLDALMRDVTGFGGRIVIRTFDTPRDLMSLAEPLIVNCTGLGARALFGDQELVPVKGQLTVLVPQPEVTYMVGGMLPRSDGIILNGGMQQRGVWTMDVDEAFQEWVVQGFKTIFDAMRPPVASVPLTRLDLPAAPPGVESFLGRDS